MASTLATPEARTETRTPPRPPVRRRRNNLAGGMATYYWMVIPALVLFFTLHTVPVIAGIFFSFTDYAGYGTWNFVGLRNYFALFVDDQIWSAYGITFWIAIISTILVNAIALSLAVALNSKIKFRSGFRATFFIPYVLAVLVVGYVFQYLFASTIPKLFPDVPVLGQNILTNPDWAWAAIVVLAVWKEIAFATILYMAGLQTIGAEVYEAADLDGASKWAQFWRITFPLIGAFFTINMVLALKNLLQIFDHVVALTNGGPGTATQTITVLIFKGGFQGGEYAYQTANAVVYLVVILAVSYFQFKFLQRREADF
jgi:raffinose/stachyose/melibiose transport system permease protein